MTRQWRLRTGWRAVACACLVVSAAALGGCGDSPKTADEALASAQAFVSDASAFRFEGVARSTYTMDALDVSGEGVPADDASGLGWSDERPGSTTTNTSTIQGSWSSDGWQASVDESYGRSEVKVFGSSYYFRAEGDDAELWQRYDLPEQSRDDRLAELRSMGEMTESLDGENVSMPGGLTTSMAASVYLGGEAWGGSDLFADPPGFMAAIAQMSDPTLIGSESGSVTLRAELHAPADVEEAWGGPLPAGTATLTIGADGAPRSLALSVRDGDDADEVEIRFMDWNEPVLVLRPDGSDVDETPWIDEEAVAAVPGVTLLAPAVLPDGWQLNYVDVISGDDSAEPCDQVEMGWTPALTDPDELSAMDDSLSVYLLPAACATDYDDTPFVVGAYAPLPTRTGAYSVEALVGSTAVQIDTTLDDDELRAMVSSLAPTDVGTLSAQLEANGSTFSPG